MKKCWMISILFIILLSACTNTATKENEQRADGHNPSTTQLANNMQQQTSKQVEELLAEEFEFNEVIVVNDERLIIVGIDPKQHDRLQLKDLRKSMKSSVETSFSKFDVSISTDQKIILELKSLRERLQTEGLSREELSKELKRIHELSKEQA